MLEIKAESDEKTEQRVFKRAVGESDRLDLKKWRKKWIYALHQLVSLVEIACDITERTCLNCGMTKSNEWRQEIL